MKFAKIPTTTLAKMQLGAGILLTTFEPATPTVTDTNILGATSGGVNFSATPTYKDFGEDIDNCPKNTKEFKRIEQWEAKMSGNLLSVSDAIAKKLVGAATTTGTGTVKITANSEIASADFSDIWWVGDYSDYNGATNGGFVAIKLKDALSNGGFQITSSDAGKGQFAFEFLAHYSSATPDTVPFEIYVKAGSAEPTNSVGP